MENFCEVEKDVVDLTVSPLKSPRQKGTILEVFVACHNFHLAQNFHTRKFSPTVKYICIYIYICMYSTCSIYIYIYIYITNYRRLPFRPTGPHQCSADE